MSNKNPLKAKIQSLRISGSPIFLNTFSERNQAHNIAGRLGYQIATRKRIEGTGYEVRRTK